MLLMPMIYQGGMREAFDKLGQEFGPDLAKRYGDNARAIINGENVPVNEVQPLKKKKHFLWW